MLRAAYRVLGRNRGQSECTSVHSKVQTLVEVPKLKKKCSSGKIIGRMYTVGRRGNIKQFETINYRFVQSFKERMVLTSHLTFLFKIRSYAENDNEDEEELRVTAVVRGKKIITTYAL